jgi:hypothetical protein
MWVDRHNMRVLEAAAEAAAAARAAAEAAAMGPGALLRSKSSRSIAAGVSGKSTSPGPLSRAKSERALAAVGKATSTKKLQSIIADDDDPLRRASTAQDLALINALEDLPTQLTKGRGKESGLQVNFAGSDARSMSPPTMGVPQAMIQSFGAIPGIVPRGPREKVPLSSAEPWHPTSPASKTSDPLLKDRQLNAPSVILYEDTKRGETGSGDEADDAVTCSPVPVTGASKGSAAARKMTAAAIFDKAKIGLRGREQEERAALLLVSLFFLNLLTSRAYFLNWVPCLL